MRKYLVILGLFFSLVVYGQPIGIMASQDVVGGAEPASYTDDFDAWGAGALAGNGEWTAWTTNGMTLIDLGGGAMAIYPSGAGVCGVMYDDTFDNDQYSKATLASSVSYTCYNSVCVRASGSGASADGYCYGGSNTNSYLYKVSDGGFATQGDTGDAFSGDDVIEIRVVGTTITAYKNGEVDTSVGTSGSFTDSDFASGVAAVGGYNSCSNHMIDWEGGDL